MNENCPIGSCGALRYEVRPSGYISCNVAVVWNAETRDAVVIDPSDDARGAIEFVKSRNLHARHILLTHAHFDHAADTDRAIEQLGCRGSLHADDLPLYVDIPWQAAAFGLKMAPQTTTLNQVEDEQSLDVLPGYPIQVLHVPGHSAGSVAYFIAQAGWAFVGDTLFCGGVGRTDLPGGSSKTLIVSIQNRLYSLPDQTIVIPGHGPTTTIGREKQFNPFVRANDAHVRKGIVGVTL